MRIVTIPLVQKRTSALCESARTHVRGRPHKPDPACLQGRGEYARGGAARAVAVPAVGAVAWRAAQALGAVRRVAGAVRAELEQAADDVTGARRARAARAVRAELAALEQRRARTLGAAKTSPASPAVRCNHRAGAVYLPLQPEERQHHD